MIAAASPATRASRTGAWKRRYELCLRHSGSGSGSNLVQVPEEEQLPPAGGGASHMAKEVAVDVPESSIKAQDHLQNIENERLSKNAKLESTLLRLP